MNKHEKYNHKEYNGRVQIRLIVVAVHHSINCHRSAFLAAVAVIAEPRMKQFEKHVHEDIAILADDMLAIRTNVVVWIYMKGPTSLGRIVTRYVGWGVTSGTLNVSLSEDCG